MTTRFPTTRPEPLPPASPADALLRGEDAHAYHQLRRRLVAEMRPRDTIEEVLVGDVCDLVWEAARYRRIRARALEARMDLGVARIVEPHEEDFGSPALSDGWARGEERDVRLVDEALAAAGLGPEHVAACAFLAQVGDMERLDRLIAATEIRRAAALREIERHRAARLRELAEVAEVEDEAAEDRRLPAGSNLPSASAETMGVFHAVPSGGSDVPAGSRRSQERVAEAEVFERWGGLA